MTDCWTRCDSKWNDCKFDGATPRSSCLQYYQDCSTNCNSVCNYERNMEKCGDHCGYQWHDCKFDGSWSRSDCMQYYQDCNTSCITQCNKNMVMSKVKHPHHDKKVKRTRMTCEKCPEWHENCKLSKGP